MSIAFDAATGGNASSTTSLTFSHTCSGANRWLGVSVVGDSTDIITGVTYNGIALTLIDKVKPGTNPANLWHYAFALQAPASGAHNIVVTASGTAAVILAAASSYTGVGQNGNPERRSSANNDAANTLTPSVTTVTDNAWTVLFGAAQAGTPTAGTGSTKRVDDGFGGVGVSCMFDSNGVIHPAGSRSMTFTQATSANAISGIIVSVYPSTASVTVARFLGDSITEGFNATSVGTNDWASLVCAALGWIQENRAYRSFGIKEEVGLDLNAHGWGQPNGEGAASGGGDLSTGAFSGPSPDATSKTLALVGFNDMRFAGTDADALEANRRCLRAALAWRSRATADIKQGNDGGWTYTGSWSNLALPVSSAAPEVNGKYTTTSGDKGSISVIGTAITVAYLCYHDNVSTGATFTTKIDGVSVGGTIDTEYGAATGNRYNTQYSIMAVRFSGLSAGSHTLELTATSSNFFVIGFVCGSGESTRPSVYISGPPKLANYTGGISAYNNGSDAAVTAYTTMVSDLVTERVADGGSVFLVPVNSYYVTGSDIDTDTIHPTNTGHGHIRDAFLATIAAGSASPSSSPSISASPSPSPSSSPSISSSPSTSPSASISSSPSPSVSASPSHTPSASISSSIPSSPSPSPSAGSPSPTPSASISASPSPSPSASPSSTPSASISHSPSQSPSATGTPSASASPTGSPSRSRSSSPSHSPSHSHSHTPSHSPSTSRSSSPSTSSSPSRSKSSSPSKSPSKSHSHTPSSSKSHTPSTSLSHSRSASPSKSVSFSLPVDAEGDLKAVLFSRPLENLVRVASSITVTTGSVVSGYGTDRLANGTPAYPFQISGTSLDIVFDFGGPVLIQLPAILHSNLTVAARIQGHTTNTFTAPDIDVAFGVPTIDARGFFSAPWLDLSELTAKRYWRLHIASNGYPIIIGELWLGQFARSLPRSYLLEGLNLISEGQTVVHETNARVELAYEQATVRERIDGSFIVDADDLAELDALVRSARFQARPFLFVPRSDVDDAWLVKYASDAFTRTPLVVDEVTRIPFPVRQVGRDLSWIDPDA